MTSGEQPRVLRPIGSDQASWPRRDDAPAPGSTGATVRAPVPGQSLRPPYPGGNRAHGANGPAPASGPAPATAPDAPATDATGDVDPIKVLVADDHALFRRGLEMVLRQEPDIQLVAEASDGAEAVARAAETLPDVVLLDVRMPKRTGIEACAAIKEVCPSAKIIMLTISDEEADLYEAIKAGAMGYLLKEISIDEVAAAIRAVHGGQSLISPSMASKLLNEFASLIKRGDARHQVPAPKLTEREMEVLRLVAKGLNNRDIAKQLFISENTVKNHVRNILEKLQLHSRMEAVVYAVREKLLEIT
ncbi:two component transcriptional regulator, LuxR family [Acidothermus cellulolyticus 11B]|jgi:DNA-binding NarL/FixJ family response regulator|uniref:Two component transcriptional regulator, LuxR family n=1 Tax=Acidothermus cellulolyticus (strain ATCC 43068 / DSM 8971 / 11B) TaxID=351607 RepID=A0LVS2_ACIC1|nr:response regulator transcription factor [Acidothermus cellulolyticus]ABK53532.1 two component transcriptional regulator, LuxR family [Acidothermus cellulolyticus 11B]MCL6550922.1 response regulator transcription factor [Acidothermus cellulolyticus]